MADPGFHERVHLSARGMGSAVNSFSRISLKACFNTFKARGGSFEPSAPPESATGAQEHKDHLILHNVHIERNRMQKER